MKDQYSSAVRSANAYVFKCPRNHVPRVLRCDRLVQFVSSSCFTWFMHTLVVANGFLIGFQADYELRKALNTWTAGDLTDVLTNLEIFFTVVFILELVLKFIAFECDFFFGKDWAWNVFDVLLVGMNLVETALVGANFDIAYIRILRLSRVARTLRVVRSAPFLIKLRTMVNAIVNSIPSLFWAFSLLAFVVFVFGTIFAQGIVQVLDTQETFVHIDYIQRFCASLPMTLLTLFMAITSGISWWDLEAVLLDINAAYGILLCAYIAVMVLALLNVVTGIFVNDALEMAQLDRDLMKKYEMDRRAHQIHDLRKVFAELDVAASGKISMSQFTAYMKNEEAIALFAVLGIEVSDALILFNALDLDESQEVEVDEFVIGCMNLRGNARNVDMVTLLRENKRVLRKLTDNTKSERVQMRNIEFLLRQLVNSEKFTPRVHQV